MSIGFSAGGHGVQESCKVGVSLDTGAKMLSRLRSISLHFCTLLVAYPVSRRSMVNLLFARSLSTVYSIYFSFVGGAAMF